MERHSGAEFPKRANAAPEAARSVPEMSGPDRNWINRRSIVDQSSGNRPPATHREVRPGVVLILPPKSRFFGPFFSVKVVPEGGKPSGLVLLMPAKGRPGYDFGTIVKARQHHLGHILEPS